MDETTVVEAERVTTPRVRRRATGGAWARGLLLVALALLAYLPALRAGFTWDDDEHVTANPNLRDVAGLARTWAEPRSLPQYYPVTHAAFWIQWQWWGASARGYHLVNVALHGAGAVVLWRLLRRLRVPGALLGGALFAAHPLAVESVAWVTELKNVLSALLALSAALLYVRWDERRSETKLYAWAVALFAGALLSKTTVAVLPPALLVVAWWRRGRIAGRDVVPLVPFFLLAVPLGLYTSYLERVHVGARGREWDYAPTALGELAARTLIAGRGVWFYVGKTLWPADLAFIYERRLPSLTSAPQWAAAFAVPVLLIALVLSSKRIGHGPAAVALLFVGALVPALGWFNVFPHRYSFVADHFAHLALIAACAGGAAGLALLGRRFGLPIAARPFVAGAVVLVLAGATFARARAYESRATLFADAARKSPGAWMPHVALAQLAAEAGDLDARRAHVGRALAAARVPDTLVEAARVALADGRAADALALADEALALDSTYLLAQLDRADALDALGRPDEARAQLGATEAAQPRYAPTQRALAAHLERRGQLADAEPRWRVVADTYPDDAEAQFRYGALLLRRVLAGELGRDALVEAKDRLERSALLRPAPAPTWAALATANLGLGRVREAAVAADEALVRDRGNAEYQRLFEVARGEYERSRAPATTRATQG